MTKSELMRALEAFEGDEEVNVLVDEARDTVYECPPRRFRLNETVTIVGNDNHVIQVERPKKATEMKEVR